ncbi:unnamed protein product, partial [Meganyctiphanes norvegica]
AFSSVKFKDINSVYRAYRLLNGKTICGNILYVVVPLEDSFTKKEKVKKHEVSEKQALDRIQEIFSKVEKKKKLLKSYLKSATREKESKLQGKKEVGKEEIVKKESAIEAKRKEKIVEKKLNDTFDLKPGSSHLFPCIASDEPTQNYHSSDEDNDRKRSWRTESDKRKQSNPERKRNKEKRSKSPSNGQGYASRSKYGRESSPQNPLKDENLKDTNVDTGRRKRSSSRDRKDRTSFSNRNEGPRSSDQKKYKNSENSGSSRTPLNSTSSKVSSGRSRSRSPGRPRRTRSRSRERIKRSRSKDIDRNRIKRSRSRDIDRDRKKRSRSRDTDSYKSGQRGLTEAEIRSSSGDYTRIREGRNAKDGVFYRDKAPWDDRRSIEKNQSRSRENSLSRLHDSNPLSKEHEAMRSHLTPIQEDRSHSRSRSPAHHKRSNWSERDESLSSQLQLPVAPPAPHFAKSIRNPYNQPGLISYPAMFGGSDSPDTTKEYQNQPDSRSYHHLSESGHQSKMSNTVPVSSSSFSVLGVCNMLYSMCDQLDIYGQSLKLVLEKAFVVKHDEKKMLEVFAIGDHINLMRMVLHKLSKLSEVAPDAQTKSTIEKMVIQTKSLIKMAEDPSSFSTSSATDFPSSNMNFGHSSSTRSLMHGIDVERAARLTLNRNTQYIIAHIKHELGNLGTIPTKEIVSRLALEISVLHFKMAATDKGSFPSIDYGHSSSVDYGHGSSSSSLNKQSVSIDYGHGSTKSQGSSSNERNWGKDEVVNRSGNLPGWETENTNPSFSQYAGQMEHFGSRSAAEVKWNQQLGTHCSADSSSSGMSVQQSVGHVYQSSGNTDAGNAWTQSQGNMGNAWEQNQGNTMVPHTQWPYGTQGQVYGTQEWPQSQSSGMVHMWPQGQSSDMPLQQGSLQDQGYSHGGGNVAEQWPQGYTNKRS